MVDFPASQRQKVNLLHGTSAAGPSNYRDASNPKALWKNPPTPISAPSQARGLRREIASPYDRMTNPRQPQPLRPGNPNSHATLLSTHQRPRPSDPKRPKLDENPYSQTLTRQNNNSRLTNSINTSSRRAGQPVASTSDAEIQIVNRPRGIKSAPAHHRSPNDSEIVELSDMEDLGVVVSRPLIQSPSADPLLLGPGSPPHDFETLPGTLQHLDPRKGKGKDFAQKPQTDTAVMSDIEEIEDFTSEPANDRPSAPQPLPSQRAANFTPSIPRNIVKKRRETYESANYPMLDLKNKNALSRFPGVAKQMKPKGATKSASSKSQLDPIATESTAFTSKSLTRTKESPLRLPLRAWAMGLKIFLAEEGSDPPFFGYDPQNGRLEVSMPGQYSYWFHQPSGFEDITVTNDSDRSLTDNVVIQLRTKTDCEVRGHGLLTPEFEPGSNRHAGLLTFFFRTDGVEGWTTTYQKLVSLLTKSVPTHNTVRPTGAKSIWETVQQHADMYRQRASHSSDSSRKSIARSIKNLSPPRATRSSTGNSRIHMGPDTDLPNSDAGPLIPLRRSSRRSAVAAPETLSESPPLADPEELILVYPPSGPGALNIMGGDLNRLRPHEFLNDTLIEFGLKLWLTELGEQDKDLADQIHVFSSFFYKKLNNKKSLDEGYQSVKKWTSKVDIFSKKYIVVPINENLHWYLAIIYEPEHTLLPPLPPKVVSLSQRGKLRRKNPAEPDVKPDTQKELPPDHDLSPMEGPSEPDVEMASPYATCASTPSITQDEDMDDISPIEFSQSCSISNIPLEKPRSSSSFKPISIRGRSASVGKASGRSVSVGTRSINEIESTVSGRSPRLDSMDVDVTVIDVEADQEGTELKEIPISSKTSTSTEVSNPPSTLSSKPSSRRDGIPPLRFYGPSRKGKQKAEESDIVPDSEEEHGGDDDEKHEQEVDAMLGGVLPSQTIRIANDPPITRIFTLDSLGSRHPQAHKVLRHWLNAEAKDKRNIVNVRPADAKLVPVPSQPNFADCGVYLLHFAKTFLSRPAHYFDLIYQAKKVYTAEQRRLDWDEAVVKHYREDLIQRITQLSKEWKTSRAVKEEDAKRKRKSEELRQADSDSEVEVDIVEDIKLSRASSKPEQRPAKRMRG